MTRGADWVGDPVAKPDIVAAEAARQRQAGLLKPPGALGRLEELAIRLAGLQGTNQPTVDPVRIGLFAADHGVCAEGISAYPQAVTGAMLGCFARGDAAIGVLARELNASLEVVNVGTVEQLAPIEGVSDARIAPGTANFIHQPAMSLAQLAEALAIGRDAADRARRDGIKLWIGGEMGIGNTTSAAALACAWLDEPPERLAGPGTGLDPAGLNRKIAVIRAGLDRHRPSFADPHEVLRRLGGFEIAALAGAYVRCAQSGLAVLVDGFICSAAALAAERLCPGASQWLISSHNSAEPGHRVLIAALGGRPLLDLGLRLGEGSGAAVALPLLRLACALHREMGTLSDVMGG